MYKTVTQLKNLSIKLYIYCTRYITYFTLRTYNLSVPITHNKRTYVAQSSHLVTIVFMNDSLTYLLTNYLSLPQGHVLDFDHSVFDSHWR